MMTRTQIMLDRDFVVKFLVQAMHHYNDKVTLIIQYNMGNHWLLLSISTMYDQVWYRDSTRPTDPNTGEQLTRDYTDVISVLDM
jgi:hypothetical protein